MKTMCGRAAGASLVIALCLASADARADAPDLAARCRETGEHLVCAAAGAPLEATTPEVSIELYAVECGKRPEQCHSLVAYAQRLLKKKDAVRATQLLERGCDLKSARACSTLAVELEEGERGIAVDAAKAARFYDRACELGRARACALLAVMVDDGRGVRRDPARAAKLRGRQDALEKAAPRSTATLADTAANEAQCRKNRDASRCVAAAAIVQDTDAVKAEELFRIGCGLDKATCGLWGFAVERYRHDDPSRAQRILEEGCVTQNTALACVVLADMSHAGYKSIPRNESRAAELYERACTLGEPIGCRATASRFRGVKNTAKADELRDLAISLEAEADKATAALQDKWVKGAPLVVAREPFQRELERRRAEWLGLAARARARWEVRMQRLAAVEAGSMPEPLSPAPATDADHSASRGLSIKRMAKALFP